jgi:hypothetical protein
VSGYSGTPLAQKLGIKAGCRLFADSAPANYLQLLAPLPARVRCVARLSATSDVIHVFTTGRADAARWMSWPKKSCRVATEVTEDTIRELALPLGLVGIKVCAVDETWSALKLVIRRSARPLATPAARTR